MIPIEVAQPGLVLDLGDDARPRAEPLEQPAQDQHVFALADERQRDEVEPRLGARPHVLLVLLGQGRQVDVDAGQVDVASRPELAGVNTRQRTWVSSISMTDRRMRPLSTRIVVPT